LNKYQLPSCYCVLKKYIWQLQIRQTNGCIPKESCLTSWGNRENVRKELRTSE